MPKFTLDFSIYSSEDRMQAIRNIPLETLNKSELETVTNYVLYGKDQKTDSSVVDRKEVQIKTKFNSYNKDRFVSLDEMMEKPTFDESILSNDCTIYKKVKPTIDREKAKNVPGMKELWDSIDRLQKILDQNQKKEPFDKDTPRLTQKQIYYLKHHLIQLRTQQYYLMDSQFPTICAQHNKTQFHGDPFMSQMVYPVYPRGTLKSKDDIAFKEPRKDHSGAAKAFSEEELQQRKAQGKPFINFLDKEHLYHLILHYQDIESSIDESPESPLWELLWTLDFYIEKANLSPQQLLIVEDKKKQTPNKIIKQHLMEQLGISHQENYISTIWNKAVGLIAAAAELNYDEYLCKDYSPAWKKCSRCGKELFRDSRNFVRKSKSSDGLTGRCKACDKEIRAKRQGA